MKKQLLLVAFAATLTLAGPAAQAQPAAAPYVQAFVTHHTGTFGGQKVSYTATVGSLVLPDAAGQPAVNFVTTAYVRDGVADPGKRPVIFLFAGGPSGASVAYHMRFMGPRQLIDANVAPKLRDNSEALLDIVDLVFVDPPEAGFSRVLPGGKRADFYSVNGDTAAIRQFMEKWLADHGRANAPRYVMGGSYGSVRALRIGWDSLKSRPVDGVIVTANCMMLQEQVGVIGDMMPLAAFAATAVYHGKARRRGRTDDQIVEEAYKFQIDEYLPALARVNDLTPAERAAMAEKLHAITGLPTADILAKDLVISRADFQNGLLKAQGKKLSDNYDGRAVAPAGATPPKAGDVNLDTLKTYLSTELGVTYPMADYRPTAPDTGGWDYHGPDAAPRNDWPSMAKDYLEKNPRGFIYSANGLYDLQCTTGQAHWLVSRTNLIRDRFYLRQYPGGHGLYQDPSTASILLKELRKILTVKS
jgi:carboxypeptidase C (cathepsin A)